uniref:Uncharacterized protein n=1 Tax=Seriola lalandi dorsalis TaxID=1841481 RepID=A0A3B4Y2T0_SERLL
QLLRSCLRHEDSVRSKGRPGYPRQTLPKQISTRVSAALLQNDAASQKHTGADVSHQTVVGSSPVHIQALQQHLGDLDVLSRGVARDVQAFAELSRGLLPLSVSEQGVALIEQVAHEPGEEVLGRRKRKKREYTPPTTTRSSVRKRIRDM